MLNSGGQTIDMEGFLTQRVSSDKLLIVPDEIGAQVPPRIQFEVNNVQNKVKKLKTVKLTKLPTKSQFFIQIHENNEYRELISAIEDIERNELQKAKQKLQRIIEQTKLGMQQARNKLSLKQWSVTCIQAYYYLSKVQQSEGLVDEAISTQKMLLASFDIQDLHIKGQLMLSLGNLYRVALNFQEALHMFFQALITYERLNWKVQQADCLLQLGIVYAVLNEADEAKAVTYEALEIYRENVVETNIKVGKAYLALGKIFYHSKAFEVANEYLQKSLNIHLDYYKCDYDFNFIQLYNLLGMIHQIQKQIQLAIDYYTLAVRCYRGTFDAQLGQILNNIGVAYLELKKYEMATDFFNHADQVYSIYFEKTHNLRQRVELNLQTIKLK